jgi:S1-C subfamily serine protease
LKVGDIVLAMGNPLGLAASVTDGIVSATGRTISEPTAPNSPGATLPDVIQTSAAINPGNSGGALVDLAGDVVGVPTLAAVDPQIGGAGSAAPGIGFAIPSKIVKDIAGQLVTGHGHVADSHRAELGVQVVTVLDQADAPLGVGIVVVSPGGPAAAAGIKPGEIITAIDGSPVHTTADLTGALAGLAPGKVVPVVLATPAGASRTVQVTLGQLAGS